jgi:hypothetical protein
MISQHDFNTRWWGRPVAIVRQAEWFDGDAQSRSAQLAPYAWAEYKSPLVNGLSLQRLATAGFVLSEMQMAFRIGLDRVQETPSTRLLDCRSASERPFELSTQAVAPFQHERFAHLPGATNERITERFVMWSQQLMQAHPDWALQISIDGKPQGWFIAEPTPKGLFLALAMLAKDASLAGANLYRKALTHFAAQGQTIGHAGFSANNTAVLNIYAQLGARFTAPRGIWLWQAPQGS